jgi:hypothetical protein
VNIAKKFRLSAEQIRPLAKGLGACVATDRILIDGCRVGYMYREAPDNNTDSGWRFLAGDENDSYMDNAANHGIYDVNTIANYDPEIIPYLASAVGCAFERVGGGRLLPVR